VRNVRRALRTHREYDAEVDFPDEDEEWTVVDYGGHFTKREAVEAASRIAERDGGTRRRVVQHKTEKAVVAESE